MKIRLINPNTTQRMTDAMGRCAREVAAAGTEIVAVSPPMGPPSIEGYYDEALATPGLLAEIVQGERDGCDAYVIACFGDPGLYAARGARGPVIGIAEAAMHAASVLAPGFSVVTTLARTCGMAWHLAERYGMKRFCRNVRATDVAVLGFRPAGASAARRIIVDECRRALDEDGADAIVLGCAGMAEFAHEIEQQIGAPVVEGVTAAVKCRGVVALRLATAKRGDYARPLPKRYDGAFARFSPPDGDQAEPVANLPQPHIHTV